LVQYTIPTTFNSQINNFNEIILFQNSPVQPLAKAQHRGLIPQTAFTIYSKIKSKGHGKTKEEKKVPIRCSNQQMKHTFGNVTIKIKVLKYRLVWATSKSIAMSYIFNFRN